jgi:hypothetical protein
MRQLWRAVSWRAPLPDCHLFTRSLGLGGSCPDCDAIILLGDLLELEIDAPS